MNIEICQIVSVIMVYTGTDRHLKKQGITFHNLMLIFITRGVLLGYY